MFNLRSELVDSSKSSPALREYSMTATKVAIEITITIPAVLWLSDEMPFVRLTSFPNNVPIQKVG
jgi:hypothetical protein